MISITELHEIIKESALSQNKFSKCLGRSDKFIAVNLNQVKVGRLGEDTSRLVAKCFPVATVKTIGLKRYEVLREDFFMDKSELITIAYVLDTNIEDLSLALGYSSKNLSVKLQAGGLSFKTALRIYKTYPDVTYLVLGKTKFDILTKFLKSEDNRPYNSSETLHLAA